MYSERTFRVTCRDGKLVSVLPGPLVTDVGPECLAEQRLCPEPPALTASDVSAKPSGPDHKVGVTAVKFEDVRSGLGSFFPGIGMP